VHYGQSAADATETVAAIEALGRRAVALAADLADEQAVEALFEAACAQLGPLDAVVNNASRFEPDRPENASYAMLARHVGPNLGAPLVLARRLHALRMSTPATTADTMPAVVVNLLDQKLDNLNPDYFSYTLSKAALESATTLLAQALAPQLRVCGVAPGVTMLSGPMTGSEFTASHRMTPLGRSSTPEDVARAVRFVVESPAITGTTLLVDGGQHLQPQPRDVMFLARDAAPAAPPPSPDTR